MKTLCINLDSRPDRWEQASAEFERVGLTVERVSAVTGDNRPLAFNQSVYKCMEMARGHDLLLFEDDVVFDGDLSGLIAMPLFGCSIHLGANLMGGWKMPTVYNWHGLAVLHNCWQSHATYYSAACVHYILCNMNPNEISEKQPIFDEWFRLNILPMGRSYVIKPMIAYQRPSWSDIWQTEANYVDCFHEGNKYLATL